MMTVTKQYLGTRLKLTLMCAFDTNQLHVVLNALKVYYNYTFQAESRKAEDDMRLYYVCTNVHCCHRWADKNAK